MRQSSMSPAGHSEMCWTGTRTEAPVPEESDVSEGSDSSLGSLHAPAGQPGHSPAQGPGMLSGEPSSLWSTSTASLPLLPLDRLAASAAQPKPGRFLSDFGATHMLLAGGIFVEHVHGSNGPAGSAAVKPKPAGPQSLPKMLLMQLLLPASVAWNHSQTFRGACCWRLIYLSHIALCCRQAPTRSQQLPAGRPHQGSPGCRRASRFKRLGRLPAALGPRCAQRERPH